MLFCPIARSPYLLFLVCTYVHTTVTILLPISFAAHVLLLRPCSCCFTQSSDCCQRCRDTDQVVSLSSLPLRASVTMWCHRTSLLSPRAGSPVHHPQRCRRRHPPSFFLFILCLLHPSRASSPRFIILSPPPFSSLSPGRCADVSPCLSRTSAFLPATVHWSACLLSPHGSRACVLHPPLPAAARDCEAATCDGPSQFQSFGMYTLSLQLCSTRFWRVLCTRVWYKHVGPSTPQTNGNAQYRELTPPCLVAPTRTPSLYPSILCRLLHHESNPLCQRRASVLHCASLFWCLGFRMSLALVFFPPPPPCDNRFPSTVFGGTSSQSPAATMPPNGYPRRSQRAANVAAPCQPSQPSPTCASPVSQDSARATYRSHGRRRRASTGSSSLVSSARTAASTCAAPQCDGHVGTHPVPLAVARAQAGGTGGRGVHASTDRCLETSTAVGVGNADAAHAVAVAGTTSHCAPSVSVRDVSAPSPLPPQDPGVLVSVKSLTVVGAGGATSLPRVLPTWSVPEQHGGTTPTPPPRSLVVSPVVHLHGGMRGDVTAVL